VTKFIKAKIEAEGITEHKLSLMAGVDPNSMHLFLRGKTVMLNSPNLLRVLEVFWVDLAECLRSARPIPPVVKAYMNDVRSHCMPEMWKFALYTLAMLGCFDHGDEPGDITAKLYTILRWAQLNETPAEARRRRKAEKRKQKDKKSNP
jgi:hypothetical protein